MKNNPCFTAALDYLERGMSPIPVRLFWGDRKDEGKAEKRVYLDSWKPYQERRATVDELIEWWTRWPEAQVGIVTGAISGIVVLDLDTGYNPDLIRPLKLSTNTPCSRSPSGGWHMVYQHPGTHIATNSGIFGKDSKIDIRGDGGMVVEAPSVYPDNVPYVMVKDWDTPLAPLSQEFMLVLGVDAPKEPVAWEKIVQGVSSGSRNQSATQMAGLLINKFSRDTEWGTAWWLLKAWNGMYNSPPLSEKELSTTFESIIKRDITNNSLKKE